ncbi:hypothetical protein CcCBS67573_g07122 [Chytriomyces confervae]|uniref:RRM domain-containing protein n=1 Tax=Chytriomyces confervae TaxID=246404 RepID=A0A507EX65_9FUNG|nr:hypothetical protein CcCBS67573_g07122 [Chytriomyces confervae]
MRVPVIKIHYLWALHYLKVYLTEAVAVAKFNPSESNWRQKIHFGDCFEGWSCTQKSCYVDGADMMVSEARPLGKDLFSHKFKRAGYRYQVAVALGTSKIIYVGGGVPCGKWNTLSHMKRLKEEDFKVYKDKFLCNLKDDGTADPCKTVATMKAFLQIEAAELRQVQAQCGETDSLVSGAALQVDQAVPNIGSQPRNPAGETLTTPASWGERDKNEVFVRQLPWNISEEALKAAKENFRPTTRISLGTRSDGKPSGLAWVTFKSSEAAAKAIRCKNLAFPRVSGENVPVVMIKSETRSTQPKQGAANQALGFVFLPINNVNTYAMSVSSEDLITLNLDSAASGSLGNHPAFAQTPCILTTWSGIDGGRIAGSGSEGSISGTSEVPVVYTTPPIEHTPQATHNLLSVNDVLTKNKFSVLFDHSDMSASIGCFPADGLRQVFAKGFGKRGLFPIMIKCDLRPVLAAAPSWKTRKLVWHNCTHIGDKALERTFRLAAADGLDLMLSYKTNNSEATCNCEACVLAKMYQLPHPCSLGAHSWPDKLLEVVTADLMVFSHNNKSLEMPWDTISGLGLTAKPKLQSCISGQNNGWSRQQDRSFNVTSMNLANSHESHKVQVPGFNKEGVLLSVNEYESVVILKCILKGNLDADGACWKWERSMDARIPLPRNADLSDLKVKMENGVLRVDAGKCKFEGKHVQIE